MCARLLYTRHNWIGFDLIVLAVKNSEISTIILTNVVIVILLCAWRCLFLLFINRSMCKVSRNTLSSYGKRVHNHDESRVHWSRGNKQLHVDI